MIARGMMGILVNTQIAACRVWPSDLGLRTPFGISGGTQERASIVLVAVELRDGSTGFGEAAPLPSFNGETRDDVLAVAGPMADFLIGQDAASWQILSAQIKDLAHWNGREIKSARCAFETALLDAWLRSRQISMWRFFGARLPSVRTDYTITQSHQVDQQEAVGAALTATRQALSFGASILKIKVGGVPLQQDLLRVRAVHREAPAAALTLDANAAFDTASATEFVRALHQCHIPLELLEQPVPAVDIEGLAELRRTLGVKIAADESAGSYAQVQELHRHHAVDYVNIKLMKTGIAESLAIADFCRSREIGLMIGGMVETNLAMGVSATLAAGAGDFRFIDLDTPLFMASAPFPGGPVWDGATIQVDEKALGHGICPALPRKGIIAQCE
jgi:L-alanine-DL-glutamate epimerase-like enolase superfamily enzyme